MGVFMKSRLPERTPIPPKAMHPQRAGPDRKMGTHSCNQDDEASLAARSTDPGDGRHVVTREQVVGVSFPRLQEGRSLGPFQAGASDEMSSSGPASEHWRRRVGGRELTLRSQTHTGDGRAAILAARPPRMGMVGSEMWTEIYHP